MRDIINIVDEHFKTQTTTSVELPSKEALLQYEWSAPLSSFNHSIDGMPTHFEIKATQTGDDLILVVFNQDEPAAMLAVHDIKKEDSVGQAIWRATHAVSVIQRSGFISRCFQVCLVKFKLSIISDLIMSAQGEALWKSFRAKGYNLCVYDAETGCEIPNPTTDQEPENDSNDRFFWLVRSGAPQNEAVHISMCPKSFLVENWKWDGMW